MNFNSAFESKYRSSFLFPGAEIAINRGQKFSAEPGKVNFRDQPKWESIHPMKQQLTVVSVKGTGAVSRVAQVPMIETYHKCICDLNFLQLYSTVNQLRLL